MQCTQSNSPGDLIDINQIFDEIKYVEIPGIKGAIKAYETVGPASSPIFLFHHGIGKSALCWTLAVKYLKLKLDGNCSIICFDCRGHGYTTLEPKEDLSLSTLVRDFVALANTEAGAPGQRDVILVGHSVGGSVVMEAASFIKASLISLVCTIGGSSVDNLMYTKEYLKQQKSVFDSIDEAIEYCSRSIPRKELARVCIPPLLKPKPGDTSKFVWKVSPEKTEKFWNEWLKNVEAQFLSTKVPRLLVVTGSGYLEKNLMISHMRGEFRLEVFKKSGHSVMEDSPMKLAEVLADSYIRISKHIIQDSQRSTAV